MRTTTSLPLKQKDISLNNNSVICEMYQKGMSARKIASQIGITPYRIYPKLKEMEIPTRKGKGFYLESFKKDIIDLYKNGYSILDLAEKYNCNWTTVSRLLKRENIIKKSNTEQRKKKKERLIHFESKIKDLHNQGISYEEIGKTLGFSKISIYHFIKDRTWYKKDNSIKIQNPLPNKSCSFKGKEKIFCDMYRNGLSIYRIADILKTTPKTVYFTLKKCGITFRESSFLLDPKKDEIISLYKKGYSIKSISKTYGCCSESVSKLLKREGISREVKESPKYLKTGKLIQSSKLIKKLYEEGFSYKNIAQKIGATETGLCHFVKKQGWTRLSNKRDLRTKSFKKKDLIQKLYTQKFLSISEIAKKVNLSIPTVRKIVKGITTP